jgi:hypothetical protein
MVSMLLSEGPRLGYHYQTYYFIPDPFAKSPSFVGPPHGTGLIDTMVFPHFSTSANLLLGCWYMFLLLGRQCGQKNSARNLSKGLVMQRPRST